LAVVHFISQAGWLSSTKPHRRGIKGKAGLNLESNRLCSKRCNNKYISKICLSGKFWFSSRNSYSSHRWKGEKTSAL